MPTRKQIQANVVSGLQKAGKKIITALDENLPLKPLPLSHFLTTRVKLEAFGADKTQDYNVRYGASAGYAGTLANNLQTYIQNCAKNPHLIASTKVNDELLEKKLNGDSDEAKYVREALQKASAFSERADYDENAIAFEKRYATSVDGINTMLQKEVLGYRLERYANFSQKIFNTAEKKLERKHQKRKEHLENLFKDEDFIKNARKTFDINGEFQLENIKKEILANLDKVHGEELKKFSEANKETSTKLHRAAQIERLRLHWFAMAYENSAEMRAEIDKLIQARDAAKKVDNDVELEISVNQNWEMDAKFKNLKIEDVPKVETIIGTKLEKTADGRGYRMQFPSKYNPFNIPYYKSRHEKTAYDLASMAFNILAAGETQITFTFTSDPKNPEEVLEYARQAYLGALAVGFEEFSPDPQDPKKKVNNIKIVINKEVYTAEKLFVHTKGAGDNKRTESLGQKYEEGLEKAREQQQRNKNFIENPLDYKASMLKIRDEIGSRGVKIKDKDLDAATPASTPGMTP